MEQNIQAIIDLVTANTNLSSEDRAAIIAKLKETDKKIAITEFKLDRTEKVKKTTAILLEETIAELEQKRKAVEAQAREAQIEVAVERVRAQSMAMHQTADLDKVNKEIFNQLQLLNVKGLSGVSLYFFDAVGEVKVFDLSSPGKMGDPSSFAFKFNSKKFPTLGELWQQYEHAGDYFILDYPLQKLQAIIQEFKEINIDLANAFENAVESGSLAHQWNAFGKVSGGALGIDLLNPPSEDTQTIVTKMAGAFNLAYKRFLDLQKAEAQTRESQIQLALERVRARTMAMHQSTELADTATVLFQQIKELGFETWSCGFCTWQPNDMVEVWMGADSGGLLPPMLIPYKQEPTHSDIYEAYLLNVAVHEKVWQGEALEQHYAFLQTIPSVAAAIKVLETSGLSMPRRQCYYVGFFKQGYLLLITKETNAELNDISRRFAQVFDQTYTRFLDLQNAEAQARESQVQLALERVRARTMAMQHSDELADASFLLDSQVRALGIPTRGCGFNIYGDNEATEWFSSAMGTMPTYKTPREKLFLRYYEIGQTGTPIYVESFAGDVCKAHYEYLCTLPVLGDALKGIIAAGGAFPEQQVDHVTYFKYGYLLFITLEQAPEAHDVFIRFAKVFEQTYTRFLDLQKAEAQAREATIEAALEKIRSRSLAMHRSEELKEVMTVMFEKMTELDVLLGTIAIQIFDEKTRACDFWVGNDLQNPALVKLPYDETIAGKDLYIKQCWEAKKNGANIINKVDTVEQIHEYFDYVFANNDESVVPPPVREFIKQAKQHSYCLIIENNSALFVDSWSGHLYSEASVNILKRVAKVFEQAYVRFQDLQKAEAQSREAHIQLALERVRARTMAMQKSDELSETAQLLYREFGTLGINSFTCGYMFIEEEKNKQIAWATLPDGTLLPDFIDFPLTGDTILDNRYESWKQKQPLHVAEAEGPINKQHHKFLSQHVPAQIAEGIFSHVPDRIVFYSANFSDGYLFILAEDFFSVEEQQTIIRFAKVFEQTYTRFLDLKKAEAQAREAQIELSLERVRAKTMAMHNSNDVADTAAVMVDELKKLGIETIRCGIGIMHEPGDMEVWTISTDQDNKTSIIIGWLDMHIHPLLHGAFDSWRQKNESYYYELKDEDLLKYYDAINHYPGYPIRYDAADLPKQIHHNEFAFPEGILFAFSLHQLLAEQRKIFKRFAGVFGQTYRRYLDLKRAETQARESQIEAGLERVRSRTLAMQRSNELADTAVVLFQQLIALGIEPHRLYISTITDESGNAEFWITDEDGSKVSTAYAANLTDNISFAKMYEGWKQQKKSLVIDMQGEELDIYFRHLDALGVPVTGAQSQKRRVQYITYFSRGFIGMAAPDDQPEATIVLMERFAAVFNLTFTRFNDLKIAESHAVQAEEDLIKLQTEKRRAEDALVDLRAAQKQLIQSEKMASLGELTAGIAHEIQNPLNFVNNFSEVSTELIDEMNAELDKGDITEAKIIATDIKQNLEKINHHGKRADDIVKGMLQHSRTSSGQKEPTDINALCAEYLRLSYHGVRVKDKSFNATLTTDFDESIGKVNIIPQDIGRVLLNLFNNAFYAVKEKHKQTPTGYDSTVTVNTKAQKSSSGDLGVTISVSDNGNGIPQNIINKIFQPFFTTKPTGQGTGLGLSLCYDIIKAHGGEIKVETKEGEGSTFIIQIPV